MLLTMTMLTMTSQAQEYRPVYRVPGPGWWGSSGVIEGRLGDGDESRGRRGSQVQEIPIALESGLSGRVFVSSTEDGATFSLVSPSGSEIPMVHSERSTAAQLDLSRTEPGVWTLRVHADRKATGSYRASWGLVGPETAPEPGADLCIALDYLLAQSHVDFDALRASPYRLPGFGEPLLKATEYRVVLLEESDRASAQQAYDQAAAQLMTCAADFTVIDDGWTTLIPGIQSRQLVLAERAATPRGQLVLDWSDFEGQQGSHHVRISIYAKNAE